MVEAEKMEEFEISVMEHLEEEIKPKKKILVLLNEFGNCVLRNNYYPLIIKGRKIFVIYELIKIKSSNIREDLEEEAPFSLECYCSKIFEIFFIKENDFIYENLDEKIKCFKTLINTMNNQRNIKEENLILSEYKSKNKNCQIIYDNIFINQLKNEYLGFLCIITLYHCKNTVKFLEFFIRILQNILNIKIDFNLNELSELSIEKAVGDIIKIFDKKEKVNNIHLIFKENKIDYYPFSDDELKKNNEKNEIKNQNIDYITNSNDDFEELNDDIDDENEEINLEENKDEQIEAEDKNEKEKNYENKNCEQILEEIKKEMELIKAKSNANNKLINIHSQQIKKLNQNIDKNEKELCELEKKFHNLENNIDSQIMKIDKKNSNLNKKILRIPKELKEYKNGHKYIQSKEAFKAFIDYFYFGLKFQEQQKYSKKIYLISDKMLKIASEVNNKILEEIINLLKGIYKMNIHQLKVYIWINQLLSKY